MRCYLIGYEVEDSKNRAELRDAIRSYRTWARIQASLWAVVTDNSAKEIRDRLSEYLAGDDRLFVIRSGIEAAWKNPRCRKEWLKKYL